MKLETQVCSLELAKKLKELGVKQESLWWYVRQWKSEYKGKDIYSDTWYLQNSKDLVPNDKTQARIEEGVYISAFTCAELGEIITSKLDCTILKRKD